MAKNLVFVCGCPRSGTTALAHMLNWSDELFIGLERYGGVLRRNPQRFIPHLYTAERLATFEEGDCGYASYADRRGYSDAHARQKDLDHLESYRLLGDKIPWLFASVDVFDSERWRRKDITVIQIVRNVFDVAASYETRRQDPADRWTRDYGKALRDWASSVEQACINIDANRPNVQFAIIRYEQLFETGAEGLLRGAEAIYDLVGLKMGPVQIDGLTKLHANSETRVARRAANEDLRAKVTAELSTAAADQYRDLMARALF